MARRWTAAAVTCLATALLAGCSGGTQQASTTLPTTSAPPAAASPTLSPLGPADFPVPGGGTGRGTPTESPPSPGTTSHLSTSAAPTSLDGGTPLRSLSQDCTDVHGAGGRLDRG